MWDLQQNLFMLSRFLYIYIALSSVIFVLDFVTQNSQAPFGVKTIVQAKRFTYSPIVEEPIVAEKDTSETSCQYATRVMAINPTPHIFEYEICKQDYEKCKKFRRELRMPYSQINRDHYVIKSHDSIYLVPIIEKYKHITDSLKLSQLNKAIYVMSSVQSIPYTMVHGFSHKNMEDPNFYKKEFNYSTAQAKAQAKKIADLHEDKKDLKPLDQVGGCAEEVNPNGYFSPVEFLYHHMGDCDTRTQLLYSLLKEMDFDVIEIVSAYEGHAILAINIPVPYGQHYFMINGKKYFLWETTSLHPPGLLRDGNKYMRNSHNWKIKLS
jgi:hypothetical protein